MLWTFRRLNDYIRFALELRQLAKFLVTSFEHAVELTAHLDDDEGAETRSNDPNSLVGGVHGHFSGRTTFRGVISRIIQNFRRWVQRWLSRF